MLTLMLTLFIGALMTTKPVKAAGTRIYVWQPQGYIPGADPGEPVDLYIAVELPPEWDNIGSGVVGYTFNIRVDPAVLIPYKPYAEVEGYYLYDFLVYYLYDWDGYFTKLLYTTEDWGFSNVAEYIMGWETLGVGAGGPGDPTTAMDGPAAYGPLCKIRFRSNSLTDYSSIDIFDAYYYTIAPTLEEGKHPFDVVDDGHYNAPPTPEFPLGAAFQVGLIAAVAYVWWTRRHKLKEVP